VLQKLLFETPSLWQGVSHDDHVPTSFYPTIGQKFPLRIGGSRWSFASTREAGWRIGEAPFPF
jgi:hypothetical protein